MFEPTVSEVLRVAAVKRFADLSYFDFVSSAGGAMLEFLAKKTLPGIEALG